MGRLQVNSETLVTGSQDGVVLVWDLRNTGQPMRNIPIDNK